MFNVDKEKIGSYLKDLIDEKYDSQRKFAEKYLEITNPEYKGDALRNICNRLSQIMRGKKGIQITDLPVFSELLGVSFEEILSAGEIAAPTSTRMTNYQVAYSKDPAVWKKYVEHEDKLILNYDEYGKTVLDYIFEFKNYKFLKYLLEEGLIWFTDEGTNIEGINFGADTSIKRRRINETDYGLGYDLHMHDELRTNAIALAIENGDGANEILDAFKARECPALYRLWSQNPSIDLEEAKNEFLITNVAKGTESIHRYFSEEFEIMDVCNKKRIYIFPFLGDVIDYMLEMRIPGVELLIQAASEHNKRVYQQLRRIWDEVSNEIKCRVYGGRNVTEELLLKSVREELHFSKEKDFVSFYYRNLFFSRDYIGNLIHIGGESKNPQIQRLIDEVNKNYDAVLALKGD